MSDDDRERWDARHAVVADDVPMPPDALRGREHLVPSAGRALDVACGRGAITVWLAGRGLAVDAVELSDVALAAAAALAARTEVRDRVRWWHHDLDAGLPDGCAGPYDLIVCQRFRDPALYSVLATRLAIGGLLVITVLSEVGDAPGAWRAAPGELISAFRGWDVLAHQEADGEAALVARRPERPAVRRGPPR